MNPTKMRLAENHCYQTLRKLRWPQGIVCPHCRNSKVTIHSKPECTPRRRYLCLGCRKTFTDLTGTPFARTNLPLGLWFLSLELLGSGTPRKTSELARRLGVKWDTVFLMQRRLTASPGKADLLELLRQVIKGDAA